MLLRLHSTVDYIYWSSWIRKSFQTQPVLSTDAGHCHYTFLSLVSVGSWASFREISCWHIPVGTISIHQSFILTLKFVQPAVWITVLCAQIPSAGENDNLPHWHCHQGLPLFALRELIGFKVNFTFFPLWQDFHTMSVLGDAAIFNSWQSHRYTLSLGNWVHICLLITKLLKWFFLHNLLYGEDTENFFYFCWVKISI